MHMYVYVQCVYEQPIPKLLPFLILNTRSDLLLLSVLPSNVSASEKRKLLVAELPSLLSQVPDVPAAQGTAQVPGEHGRDSRLAVNTRLAVTGSAPSVQGKGQEGRHSVHSNTHQGEETIFWHFEGLHNSLIAAGDVPGAGEASAGTAAGSVPLPRTALTSMRGEPSPALGYSRVMPFPEPRLRGLGSLTTAKGQKNWEPNSTPAHVQRPPSVGRAADLHLMAAVRTDWVALSNSAKFHS